MLYYLQTQTTKEYLATNFTLTNDVDKALLFEDYVEAMVLAIQINVAYYGYNPTKEEKLNFFKPYEYLPKNTTVES